MKYYHVYKVTFTNGKFYYGRHYGELSLRENTNGSIFTDGYAGSGGDVYVTLLESVGYRMSHVADYATERFACERERQMILLHGGNALCLNENIPNCTNVYT